MAILLLAPLIFGTGVMFFGMGVIWFSNSLCIFVELFYESLLRDNTLKNNILATKLII